MLFSRYFCLCLRVRESVAYRDDNMGSRSCTFDR